MEHLKNIHRLIFLSAFFTCAICDWIEIPLATEKIERKGLASSTRYYAFPRNEYNFKKPSSIENYQQTPNLPAATTSSQKEETEDVEVTSNLEPIVSTSPQSYMQDRMDSLEEFKSEKLVRKSDDLSEELEGDSKSDDPASEAKDFLPFLKQVQDDLIVKGNKNFKGKINMLKNLRDELLLNIDERISHLWGESGKPSFEARDHKEDDHDMHFPSNEGALMTIGFLTFAVFLIKLVLKLVQALKAKHSMMMVSPTMMTTNAAFIGRKKREADLDEHQRILQLIDEYSFK